MDIDNINTTNVENIRHQINNKKGCAPYYSTSKTNTNVLTDYDVFPYNRYFRAEPRSTIPIVAEREAGWRPRNPDCYDSNYVRSEFLPKHNVIVPRNYFQPACTTVYPRYVNEDDILLSDIRLNENCVISYR